MYVAAYIYIILYKYIVMTVKICIITIHHNFGYCNFVQRLFYILFSKDPWIT